MLCFTKASNPSYLQRRLLSHSSDCLRRNSNSRLSSGIATNSLIRQAKSRQHDFVTHGLISTKRLMLDIWDPLEPLELAWELYCNRYEILDELVAKAIVVFKRNSVRALTLGGSALVVGEVLARLGVIGEPKQGLAAKINKLKRFRDGSKERVYQRTGSMIVHKCLKTFKRLGGKSKFAISVSAGAFFGQVVIKATTFCVKTVFWGSLENQEKVFSIGWKTNGTDTQGGLKT